MAWTSPVAFRFSFSTSEASIRGPACAPVSKPKTNGPWPFTITSTVGMPSPTCIGNSMGNFGAESAE